MPQHLPRQLLGMAAASVCGLVVIFGRASALIWLLAFVGMIGGFIWSIRDWRRAHRLRDEYQTFAQSHGWEYVATTYEYDPRFSAYPFRNGSERRQESVVRGTFNGQQCATFTHVFEEKTNNSSSTTFTHQVTLAELPVSLPRIHIVPQGLTANVAKALGGRDIDVESHAFNERWRVLCDDDRYGHAVIDPRMIERLLYDDVMGMSITIDGAAVYVWQSGRQGTEGLSKRLAVVSGIARRIPNHIIREYTERGHAIHKGDARTRPLSGPSWATEPGALTSRSYTGIGVDSDGDGIEDWQQRS